MFAYIWARARSHLGQPTLGPDGLAAGSTGGSAAMISSSLWGLSVSKLTPLVPGIPQGLESDAMCCPGQVSHVFELSLVCHNHPCHCPQKGASESLFPTK